MARSTSAEFREHHDALAAFERDYRRYVNAQISAAQGHVSLSEGEYMALRSELLRRVARAGRGFQASGVQMALTPPPMFGGPVLTDLPGQVFAHESAPYANAEDPFDAPRIVLDGISTAIGALEDRAQQAEKEEVARGQGLGRVRNTASRHLPTLWGRFRRLPRGIATAADFITVGGFLIAVVGGAGRLLGIW